MLKIKIKRKLSMVERVERMIMIQWFPSDRQHSSYIRNSTTISKFEWHLISLFLLMITLSLTFLGCNRAESDWNKSKQKDTIDAYEEFLSNHPNSEFAKDGKQRIEKLNRDKVLAESQREIMREISEILEDYQRFFELGLDIDFIDNKNLLKTAREQVEPIKEGQFMAMKLIQSKNVEKPGFENFALGLRLRTLLIELRIFEKPQFYNGKMPLILIAGIEKFSNNPYQPKSVSFYGFEEWNVFYSLRTTMRIPRWAIALGHGSIRAKAKLLEMTGNQFEVLELHYGPPYCPLAGGRSSVSGPPIFKCKSTYDIQTGFKINETEVVGTKEREYFYIWNNGLF